MEDTGKESHLNFLGFLMKAVVVAHWNVRGLRANLYQLKNYLNETSYSPDIICLQETFLKEKIKTPNFDNYNVVRKDYVKNSRGGLAILIRTGISFTILDIDQIESAEILGIRIKTEHGHLEIINTYIAPDNKIVKTDIEKFFPLKRATILGDLNAHSRSWGCTNANERGHILEEVINDRLLTVLNTGQPTRISSINSKTHSVIDLSIVRKELALNCKHYVTNNSMGSDHFLCNIVVNEEIKIEPNVSMHLWNLKKADWKEFKKNSQYYITDGVLDDNNNDTFNNIVESFTLLANETLHCKKKNHNNAQAHKKHRPIPFWNIKCTEAIYNRKRARNPANKSNKLNDYKECKHQEAIVKVTLKSEAKASWENYCSELTSQTKLGVVWDMARRMNSKASYSSIPTLTSKGLIADNELPDDWHHAIILPHLKPNKNAANPDSYRPISLTSTMCKVMERLVTNRLQWF